LRPLALLESDEPDWPTRRKVNAASSLSGRKLFVRSFGQTVLIDLADITLLALSPQDANFAGIPNHRLLRIVGLFG